MQFVKIVLSCPHCNQVRNAYVSKGRVDSTPRISGCFNCDQKVSDKAFLRAKAAAKCDLIAEKITREQMEVTVNRYARIFKSEAEHARN